SYSTSRYKNGQIMYPRPSRFIDEIEPEFLDGYIPLRNAPSTFKLKNIPPPAGSVKRNPVPLNSATQTDIPELDRSRLQPIDANRVVPDMLIFHPTFGTGKVISIEGLGVQKKAKVQFKEGGSRILLLKFAKLFAQPD
ncbi:MAG: ATP-dependent DNA helicase, partial [Odoribacter sp.]|nr:ATP-dependent DNA helicase [Odoribacter sp.]